MKFCLRCLVLCVFLLAALAGQAAERQLLKGHVPAVVPGLAPIERLNAAQQLHLAISLPLRNRESLAGLLQQLYDPASPSFHRFLTPEQFTAAYAPTDRDYQSLVSFAKSNGLTITATHANRALLEVDGSVADIEKTFQVNLRVYRHPAESRNFYSPDAEPSLALNVPVLAIAGLSDYQVPHPASLHVRPLDGRLNPASTNGSAGGLYIGQDFRSAYVQGVTNTGTGQSVGLVEFDSYYASDITTYLHTPQAGLTNSNVTLSNVVVHRISRPGSGNTEVALDIEMAVSMAPGLSTIYVYEAPNNTAYADSLFNRIASDNLSRQLSCSWSGFMDASIQQDLVEFAAQGQSFFQASGDSGEYNFSSNPVSPPCDDTNVTSVGGTTLTTTGPAGNWVSETTWNWFTTPEDGLSNAATAGGVSTTYALPPWQQGISMTANQGSSGFRNLPDVAMIANEIYLVANNGGAYFAGGTSAAAPLWAGLTALVNQRLAAEKQPFLGFANPALYAIGKGANYSSCFHDITVGNNTNSYSATQFFAVAGYDLCTGWGTPIGAGLISILAPEPLQITPSTGFVSTGPYGGPFSPANQNFLLTNVAASSFNWSLANPSTWLSASPGSGTLVSGGASANVTISLNSSANSLTVGAYEGAISLTNLADAVTQNLQFILTITKAAPVLTWTNPSAITYGRALSAIQLNATSNAPGSFAYNPVSGAVLGTGTNTLFVTFTPSDAVDFSNASASVSLVVSPAPLTVTALNAARPYGQPNPAFSGTITGLQNGDNITANYSCNATNSSPVGAYLIVPSLSDPNNLETNYTVDLINSTLTVSQAAPAVLWTNPAPIAYGRVLNSNQLNATANIPGSFAYNPPLGSVPAAGTNVLSVIFTPADTNDYSSVTNSVSLVVTPPLVLTVTSPAAGSTVGDSSLTVTGTASGGGPGLAIEYQVNGGAWLTASGTTNWQFGVTLSPGTTFIQVYATDTTGSTSTLYGFSVTYSPPPSQGEVDSPLLPRWGVVTLLGGVAAVGIRFAEGRKKSVASWSRTLR